MLMKLLINFITKMKTNIIFMTTMYIIVILGCSYVFLFQPDVKISYIYNQF